MPSDENSHLPKDHRKALKRWRDYFEQICTVEFPHPDFHHRLQPKVPYIISAKKKMMKRKLKRF